VGGRRSRRSPSNPPDPTKADPWHVWPCQARGAPQRNRRSAITMAVVLACVCVGRAAAVRPPPHKLHPNEEHAPEPAAQSLTVGCGGPH